MSGALTPLVIGVTPLVDAASIVVAHERGFFRRHGLDVTLSREPSWANVRDKLAAGALDAAHMLAPMPLAATLGVGPLQQPVITALSLSLGGNAIALSPALHARIVASAGAAAERRPLDASLLRRLLEDDARRGLPPLRFGVVFPVSMHAYELRSWLAAGGIHPERDVELRVVPPPRMVSALHAGAIDGFCVGEPWAGWAESLGMARVVATKAELWGSAPEKVLGVGAAWAERHRETHRALLRALIEAARFTDASENRAEVAALLATSLLPDVRADALLRALDGPAGPVFHRHAAGFPWRSHAVWILVQMLRWGQIEKAIDVRATAAAVHRTDLYREAAADLGEPLPCDDEKLEGLHAGPWTLTHATAPIAMGADRFFDGGFFDPRRPVDALARHAIHARSVPLDELAAAQS